MSCNSLGLGYFDMSDGTSFKYADGEISSLATLSLYSRYFKNSKVVRCYSQHRKSNDLKCNETITII